MEGVRILAETFWTQSLSAIKASKKKRALEKSFADSIAGVHKLHLHSARGNVYCVTLIRPSLSIYVEDAEGCDHICIL